VPEFIYFKIAMTKCLPCVVNIRMQMYMNSLIVKNINNKTY